MQIADKFHLYHHLLGIIKTALKQEISSKIEIAQEKNENEVKIKEDVTEKL